MKYFTKSEWMILVGLFVLSFYSRFRRYILVL